MKRFLVVGDMGGEEFTKLMDAGEIFDMMDMSDCYPDGIDIDVWYIKGWGEAPVECSFLGKWHDGRDPQRMVIVGDGVREVGYGTEH